ncbi:GntR family transcriptional regulator [Rhodococcus sp. ACS1]|uniref:DNA-binding transcriptional regulator, GntR family n=1 Tax=Rhodococcus koreensis TaxID=99653 RepID=A0A1H4TF18_9NOCA|nr:MULTISPECIES: GntR family transcriptional regulator [Rhodococcus]MDF3306201.1 GntR family transcriptional regulator [Rhodococcus sp. T2V]PBC46196.1 GntR family transcriptional regulator [Rhodococcus sp. ACS1]QSE82157.1 GntR family transcriptional regulator [Rhodococcus koreensis]SEC55042.1 DNA-binding transcriptional regulator, GntR family [Rhodococcus koreensis]
MTLSPNRPGSTVGRDEGEISLGRIQQRTTPGTVAGVLRTAILDGTLAPGSQLREAHIAADLGVSRAPLREALGILADEGLVVKIAYKGAFVAEVSAQGMAEIASLRKRLEPYAIELAMPRLAAGGRTKVIRALQDMARGADDGDMTRTIDAHMSFHRVFYELSEHGLLLDLWRSWESQLQLFLSADHQSFADLHDVVAEHERLLAIIDTGDMDAITREIDRHVHGPASALDAVDTVREAASATHA